MRSSRGADAPPSCLGTSRGAASDWRMSVRLSELYQKRSSHQSAEFQESQVHHYLSLKKIYTGLFVQCCLMTLCLRKAIWCHV